MPDKKGSLAKKSAGPQNPSAKDMGGELTPRGSLTPPNTQAAASTRGYAQRRKERRRNDGRGETEAEGTRERVKINSNKAAP